MIEWIARIGLVIFCLLGVLIVYSLVKFIKDRNVKIEDLVEHLEKAETLIDEEGFRAEAKEKDTADLQSEYARYMLEIEKFIYPDNQEFVMEMAQKANVIKEVLTERNEVIPG